MSSNGYGNSGGGSFFVLYKIINSESDENDSLFNCFPMPRGTKGPTLAHVKRHCAALHGLSHLGPEGYHWRVCVEDKPVPGDEKAEKSFSWWDIQDENAHLPLKQATQSQLKRFFAPPKEDTSYLADPAKAAKGVFKSMGKAMTAVAGGDSGSDTGPPVTVIAFKLLDMVKMHDDFSTKNHGRGGRFQQESAPSRARTAVAKSQPAARTPAPAPAAQVRQQQYQQQQQPRAPTSANRAAPARAPAPAPAVDNLMDFGAPVSNGRTTSSASSGFSSGASLFSAASSQPSKPTNPNESRTEKLKREYQEKNQKANRVWDEIDQRWVEVDPKASGNVRGTGSAPPGANAHVPKKKEVGISLDPTSAVGKSAGVQAAVNKRVNDMRMSQQKALQEVRAREEAKKKSEAEEDVVRQRLDPKIKVWSEEHGKKKQLRALLASLHTVLWPGAQWKQVTIGDLLDDKKVKLAFHKASRVVHPDKTHHLEAEQRFLAKRIFDALSQAKTEFDNGKK